MAKNKKNDVNKLLKFRFGLNHRISIYEKLKSYAEEEFPVYDSLLKFKQRYDKKKDYRGKIIGLWLEKMKNGLSFTKSVEGWIPESELNLISAGEEGKGIEKGLGEAIKFAKSAQKIKNTIISGSIYPTVLLVTVIIFIAMFSIQMAPTYLSILPLEHWPQMAQVLYMISTTIVHGWYIFLTIATIITIAIVSSIGKWVGKVRNVFDNFPPWSVYKVYHASSFLISLASMMQSGTPLNDCLVKIKRTSSPWLVQYIDEMMKNLRRGGKNFGQHLNVGLLDEETAMDVVDYSELGTFEESVYKIGEKNLEDSVKKIEIKMGVVKNLLLVLVGITVGWIYFTNIQLNSDVADYASTSQMNAK